MFPAFVRYSKQDIVHLGLLFVAYLATALIGIALYQGHTSPILIWPPAGIAVAGLYLGGYRLWPGILLASLIAFTTAGLPLLWAAPIAASNALQATAATYLLHALGFDRMFARLRDAFAMVLVSSSATMIVPTIGVITLAASGILPAGNPIGYWGTWWAGEILSVLILTPLLVRWLPRFRFKRAAWEYAEIGAAFSTTIILGLLFFWTPYTALGPVSLLLLSLIPLFWIALRLGPRAMTFALFSLSVIALSGTVFGAQAPPPGELAERLLSLQVLLIAIASIFLIFVATEEERKEGAQKLEAHVQDLEVVLGKLSSEDRAKTEFLATLAHELRNPMAPIMSSLELIKLRGPEAPESKELLEVIENRVSAMSHLLNDLLDISRISRKKFKIEKQPVRLNDVVQTSVQAVEPLMEDRRHSLSVSVPEHDIWVEGDALRLEQVLVNVLNNAAKYTEPGGSISLSCSTENGEAVVRIRDTGIGIAPEKLKLIFKPFQQIRTAMYGEGLGIGLSLTKRLVELHGGTVTAHSDGLGHGSEFVIRLPVPEKIQLPMKAAGGGNRSKEAKSTSHTILVVDDNAAAAEGLGRLLEIKGHNVSIVYDGESALSAARSRPPAVVLLDIGLPDRDGYDVARALRKEQGYNGTIIALTGYGQDEDRLRAQQAGFDHHLTKPVGIDDVLAVLPQQAKSS